MRGDEEATDGGAMGDAGGGNATGTGGGNATGALGSTADEVFSFESFEFRPSTGEHRAVFDHAEMTPSVAAIAAASKVTGIDSTEIDPPLYAAIDPSSLDDLL